MSDRLLALAWRQHGAFSAAQATALGIASSTLSRHASAGLIVRRAHGVYVLSWVQPSVRQTLMVEVLAAGGGAMATADSALALWCPELPFPRRPVVAAERACGHRTSAAQIIRSSDLSLAKPGLVDGIPVVGIARALLDAASSRTADEVVALIDACRRHRPVAFGALVEALHAHARPGRPGITTFREALALLTAEVPDSEFERLAIRALVRAGVEEPRLHHLVVLPGEDPIELDLDWPGRLLDVELDGRDHLTRMRTARRDRQRDRILVRAGYAVARYVWLDYLEDGPGMIDEIGALVLARGLGAGTSASGG